MEITASRATLFTTSLRSAPFISKRHLTSIPAPRPLYQSQAAMVARVRTGSMRCMAKRITEDTPPVDLAELFPGCDCEHWLVVTNKPGGEGTTKQQMIDFYTQTLAQVVGSEEEAKRRIYSVSCDRYFGFGCQISEETSAKLEGLPGVLFVLPDAYVDVENKDYGGELFVNGEIVEMSPERQKRVEPVPQRAQDRFRHNDRTLYAKRRHNQW